MNRADLLRLVGLAPIAAVAARVMPAATPTAIVGTATLGRLAPIESEIAPIAAEHEVWFAGLNSSGQYVQQFGFTVSPSIEEESAENVSVIVQDAVDGESIAEHFDRFEIIGRVGTVTRTLFQGVMRRSVIPRGWDHDATGWLRQNLDDLQRFRAP